MKKFIVIPALVLLGCSILPDVKKTTLSVVSISPPSGSTISDTDTVSIAYACEIHTTTNTAKIGLRYYCDQTVYFYNVKDSIPSSSKSGVLKYIYGANGVTCSAQGQYSNQRLFTNELCIDDNLDGSDETGLKTGKFQFIVVSPNY